MSSKTTVETTNFTPIKDMVFVSDLDSGVKKTAAGVIIPDDNMTERGIRERWAKVHSVGPLVKDVKPGQWVLLQHGRWTNGIDFKFPEGDVRLWRIDYPEAVLLVSDEDPRDKQTIKF